MSSPPSKRSVLKWRPDGKVMRQPGDCCKTEEKMMFIQSIASIFTEYAGMIGAEPVRYLLTCIAVPAAAEAGSFLHVKRTGSGKMYDRTAFSVSAATAAAEAALLVVFFFLRGGNLSAASSGGAFLMYGIAAPFLLDLPLLIVVCCLWIAGTRCMIRRKMGPDFIRNIRKNGGSRSLSLCRKNGRTAVRQDQSLISPASVRSCARQFVCRLMCRFMRRPRHPKKIFSICGPDYDNIGQNQV